MVPNDVILKHFCHRRYRDGDGKFTETKSLKAAYFHLKLDCVRKVVPQMELSHVIINDEISQVLTDGHKKLLQKFGLCL